MSIDPLVKVLFEKKDSQWARTNYLPTVKQLIEANQSKKVIEIGGGRDPALSAEEIDALQIEFTSSDILESELALAPNWVETALFDVQTADKETVAPFANQYDFAFSRMVMEHVESYERAYANIHEILRPGGVSIAFHPVYYAFPFLLNTILPEHVSQKLLARVFPNRTISEIPKFPAFYSGCKISSSVRDTIKDIGFSKVWQVPFYGHTYYGKFPIVRGVHSAVTRGIANSNMTLMSSFCYTIAYK